MTYRKPSRDRLHDRSGFLLLDLLIGIALASMLIGTMAYAALDAQMIYVRSAGKEMLLSVYAMHAAEFSSMLPGESKYRAYDGTVEGTVAIGASARWYGNDRIETDIEASSSRVSVAFTAVRAYPYGNSSDAAGTPLCSVEFGERLTIIPIILPVGSSVSLTDVEVRNGIAYISADSTRQPDPDMFVMDIRDPKVPRVLSSLNTGPGLTQLAIAGTYAYAAAASTAAQLHVVRIAAPDSLQLLAKYALPLPEASTSPPRGTAVFYDKGRVYLGTEKWDGDEFSVVDVSDPSDPSKIAGLETGSKIPAIYVRNGVAYVAASDQDQLRFVDVNTNVPRIIRRFSPSGWQRQEGKSIISFEDTLSFGRTSGGFNIIADHELFGWGSSTEPISADISGGIYGIIRDRSHVYAITHASGKEFAVFAPDMSTTTAAYYPLPAIPQAITCDSDTIYILASDAPMLYEITFSKN